MCVTFFKAVNKYFFKLGPNEGVLFLTEIYPKQENDIATLFSMIPEL